MDRMSPVRQDVTVVGRRLEPEDHRLRDFLTRIDQAYAWVEAGTPEAAELLARHGVGEDQLPLLLAPDGAVSSATVERVADAWHESDPPSTIPSTIAIGITANTRKNVDRRFKARSGYSISRRAG